MVLSSSKRYRIIMHAYVDENNFNAQNLNAREIALRLDPDLFEVTLFYFQKPDSRLVGRDNIKLIKLPRKKFLTGARILRELLKSKYDLFFYVRNLPIDYRYFKIRRYFLDRKVTIHTIENALPIPASEEYNMREKLISKWSDYVFSVSHYVAKTVLREIGIKTDVMYVGVDTNIFKPVEKPNKVDEVRVLYVGSLQERKRPYLVLEAAKRFPSVKFIIVGRGPLKDRLIKMKAKYNLGNVIFLESLSLGELVRVYQSSDIFLFPSAHEGLPKVTLEAAACGLPLIVFRDYEPESVINGKTGFIVDSVDEMYEKLDLLISDRELREKMGNAGSEYVKKFDWNVIAKKWEEIFINAIEKKN